MEPNFRSSAYYELPIPIVVADDVLGTVCHTRIAGAPAQIHTPLPEAGAGNSRARAPVLPGGPAAPPRIPSASDWVVPFDHDVTGGGAVCLRRIGVVLQEPTSTPSNLPAGAEPRIHRIGTSVPAGMDRWVASLRTWVEVLTEQDLDRLYPQLDASYLGSGLWISDAVVTDVALAHIEPLDYVHWQAVLQRIADDVEPPVEHLIARDARAMYERGDHRRAVLYAGTATEVALRRLLRDNPAAIMTSGGDAEQHQQTLEWLWAALGKAGVGPLVEPADFTALLRALAAAFERGQEMTRSEVRDLLRTVSTIVKPPGQDLLLDTERTIHR